MFPEVERVAVTSDELSRFQSETEFMGVAVDLVRETASYVCVAACIMGPGPTWSRDRAIIGGHAVRLFKLLAALLDQVCQRRRETADILSRLIFETAVNVRYLIRNWSPELADSFVRYSLRHERKLRDLILKNIEARCGERLPIEERMLRSLDRTARTAGIPLDLVDLTEKAPWGGKHLAQRARDIDWIAAYDAVFGGMSHNVHGSWQDLYAHHLDVKDEKHFTPDLDWSRPRPQPLFALARLSIQVVADVSYFLGGDKAYDALSEKLDDLVQRIETADDAHESYVAGKTWPET